MATATRTRCLRRPRDDPTTTESTTDDPTTTDGPGDGDGDEPGDGDGEPAEECFVEFYEPNSDTFFQAGPNTQGGCQLGWDGPWGPFNINCHDLNFGETPSHWIGLDADTFGNLEGGSFYVLEPPDAELPPGFEIVDLSLFVSVDLLEPGPPGSLLRLRTISSGEPNSWYAGYYDAEIAPSTELASTYSYRIPEEAPWPGLAFHNALDEVVVDVSLAGVLGPQSLEFEFGPGLIADINFNSEKYANGFALTSVGLSGFDVVAHALDAPPDLRPLFVVEACPI